MGPTNMFCDNEVVYKNTTKLQPAHHSIAYHRAAKQSLPRRENLSGKRLKELILTWCMWPFPRGGLGRKQDCFQKVECVVLFPKEGLP
jgi:hypothetical protein